jgi:hypothetical protein
MAAESSRIVDTILARELSGVTDSNGTQLVILEEKTRYVLSALGGD